MNDILHIDCDAFYASCEELRNPWLKNLPAAVGGTTNKSIITTANYKAREFGIHSAMPVFMAKELCPNLVLVPVDHAYYREKSREVFEIIKKYALIFEQVSVDEAYLKVEADDPMALGKVIQQEVYEKTGIGVSIGVSYNKFLAKLASDWNKPRGLTEISRTDLPDILLDLPLKKVHGLGSHGVEKLQNIGIYTIEDLMRLDLDYLRDIFGKHGEYIYWVIRGVDDRKVNPDRERKSLGKERTFAKNTRDKDLLRKYLYDIAEKIEAELAQKQIQGKTVNLKIKNADFKTQSKAITLQEPICSKEDIYQTAIELLDEVYGGEYIRLIGISLSRLSDRDTNQLTFL